MLTCKANDSTPNQNVVLEQTKLWEEHSIHNINVYCVTKIISNKA